MDRPEQMEQNCEKGREIYIQEAAKAIRALGKKLKKTARAQKTRKPKEQLLLHTARMKDQCGMSKTEVNIDIH